MMSNVLLSVIRKIVVKYTYNKKVYDICVNHPKAFEKETRAVVIEGDDIKAINDEGELVTIKK